MGGKKTFGEYLNDLGLKEKQPKLSIPQKRKLVKKGLETARRILKMKIKKNKK